MPNPCCRTLMKIHVHHVEYCRKRYELVYYEINPNFTVRFLSLFADLIKPLSQYKGKQGLKLYVTILFI